jgi:hypothetical protein
VRGTGRHGGGHYAARVSHISRRGSAWNVVCLTQRLVRTALLFLLFSSSSLAACGGLAQGADAGAEGGTGSGACPAGYYEGLPYCDNGRLKPSCCPNGAYCSPPGGFCDLDGGACKGGLDCAPDAGRAPLNDAGGAPRDDAGSCPDGLYLFIPCCGGVNDTSCSNGPGPPPPFCAALPSSCVGQSICYRGDCSGPVDAAARSVQCECI